jgi:hypothetical protein
MLSLSLLDFLHGYFNFSLKLGQWIVQAAPVMKVRADVSA